MTDFLTGGCNCGAVRFEVTGRLAIATYCHCKRCQRRSGAAASANAHPARGTFPDRHPGTPSGFREVVPNGGARERQPADAVLSSEVLRIGGSAEWSSVMNPSRSSRSSCSAWRGRLAR